MHSCHKIFLLCVANLIFCLYPHFSPAETISGEIINVNSKFKIAFSDLGSAYLKEGDIVQLYKNGQMIGNLKVLDSTSAISKLGPVDNDPTLVTITDFSNIAIGDTVKKNDTNPIPKEPTQVSLKSAPLQQANPIKPIENIDHTPEKNLTIINTETPNSDNPPVSEGNTPTELKNFDNYFKKYSENYNQITKTLNELIADKRKLQDQWTEMNAKLSEYEKQNKNLQNENDELRTKNTLLSQKTAPENCAQENQEILHLKENIETLKNKLRNLVAIVERKLDNNEQ
ncbi:MAG: hypothetical protein HQL25_02205 [Candidatus Omnitrophica bacterium]|nr:hypothetical protein [Candidatus Omnitrophota bacterium]